MSPWVRIDDTMPEDPRWVTVGADGLGLHVAALAYCNRNLTDGELPRWTATTLLPLADPTATIGALVGAGFWTVDGETVRLIDGDADKQPSKADVEAGRKAETARKATTRERRKLHAAGDHSMCRTDYCPRGELSHRDTHRDTHGASVPPDPDPTRPDRKGGEGREGLTPASAAVAPLAVAPTARQLAKEGFPVVFDLPDDDPFDVDEVS